MERKEGTNKIKYRGGPKKEQKASYWGTRGEGGEFCAFEKSQWTAFRFKGKKEEKKGS